MSASEPIAGVVRADAEPAALAITMGDVAARRLQPLPKPESWEYGYLHAERGVPVPCAPGDLVDACRSGTAVLVWTPETAAMVAPQQVPQLGAAILQAEVDDARSARLRRLVALVIVSVIALIFPLGWFLAAGAALIAWMANLRVRAAEARTEDDLTWAGSGVEPASPEVPAPSPYTLAMALAVAAIAAAQIAVLGEEWMDGMWQPGPRDENWLRLLGDPLLHPDWWAMISSGFVLFGLGTAVEAEAPRAYLPLSFVAGVAAAVGADLLLPGSPTPGAMAGLMGIAGFYAVLASRDPGPHRPLMERPAGPLVLVWASGATLAVYLAQAPLNGAGLLAGIALGLLCIPRPGELAEGDAGGAGWTEWLGRGALGMIWLSALAAIASLVLG
jgi:hypothetical protein